MRSTENRERARETNRESENHNPLGPEASYVDRKSFFTKRAYMDYVTTTVEASRCEEGASNYGSKSEPRLGHGHGHGSILFSHEPWVMGRVHALPSMGLTSIGS